MGKPHSAFYVQGYEEYLTRLRKYANPELVLIKEQRLGDNPSQKDIQKGLDEEGKSILKAIGPKEYLILLDLKGKEMDSVSFSQTFGRIAANHANVAVVVGSSYGLSDAVRKRADFSWKLSSLTFTHPMAMLILLEQIYRAFKIESGEIYQK